MFVRLSYVIAIVVIGWPIDGMCAEEIDVGDNVVVIDWATKFRLPDGVVGTAEVGNVYAVDKVKGDWLWITVAGGWIHRKQVVPVDQAEAFFTDRIEKEPTAERYFERALARFRMGRLEEASADFDEAIAADRDAKYLTGRGAVWLARGDVAKAVNDHTEAIELNPTFAAAYYNRGMAHQADGEYDMAIADYNRAIKLNDQNGRAFINRGLAWHRKHDYERAVRDFTHALEMNPMWPLPLNNRADSYNRMQRFDQAIADCDAALQLDPQFSWALVNRGNAWRGKHEWQKALEDYERALAVDENYAPAYHNRALTLAEQGEYVEALKDFQKAIELNENYASAYNGWAWILATCPLDELRDAKQAVALAEKACRLDRDEWNHFGTLAAAYARLEDWDRAAKAQRHAQSMLPESASQTERTAVAERLELFEKQQPYTDS